VVVILTLVSLLGVGYSFPPEQETFRSAIQPLITHSETPSGLPAADPGASTVRSKEESLGNEAKEGKRPAPRPPSAPAETCGELRVLIDQRHTLPADYAPADLVSLQEHRVPTLGSGVLQLRREAAEALRRLVEAATADGEELVVASAYRSYDDQQISHARLTSIYGEGAAGMSATPGHSQHQLGTAVDFTNAAASYQVWLPFGETSASVWLEHNAWRYGYVLAYPDGKERETGFQWEPWHYRYVGVKNAARIAENNLSLQEYLEREGVMPRC
jgi:zinc D-Ala-D-Ala carboxypeptidase